jgi:hypothetical protein
MVTPNFDGDPEYAPMWAGESCSDVNDIKPAGVIVRDLVREAEAALADARPPPRGGRRATGLRLRGDQFVWYWGWPVGVEEEPTSWALCCALSLTCWACSSRSPWMVSCARWTASCATCLPCSSASWPVSLTLALNVVGDRARPRFGQP